MQTPDTGQPIPSLRVPSVWSYTFQLARDYLGGAALSERFKSAFRMALAMVITYGISLAMDWDKAFWAALSVIFCSLATSGESVNASIDRIKGTAGASALALLVVALFPQDRWLFLASLSLIIAVCSYHMAGGSLRRAIWFNVGFNLPIVALLGEGGSELAPATFDMAILRAQQTALGAIVYSLVAVLVWPRRGDEEFVATVRGICRAQGQLFSDYIYLLLGKIHADELEKHLADLAAQLPELDGKLEGAAYDCPEVGLMAPTWESHIRNVRSLHLAFDRWSSGFDHLAGLDLKFFINGWEAYIEDVEACFRGVDDMLAGQPFAHKFTAQGLTLNTDALTTLSLFQRAAVVSCCDRLLSIGSLAEALFDSAERIRRQDPGEPRQEPRPPAAEPWTIDLDRLATTVRQTSALWLTFLAVIYIESIPIAVAVVALANAFAMSLGQLPHVPATVLYKPVVQGGFLGGAFYMVVMPHLSGYFELGVCLFAVIFAIAYVFHSPRQIVFRALWMTMLVLIMGVDNQQAYSFVIFASWFMVGVLFVTILAIAWRFPISFRPEVRLRAQFRRYWCSAAFMLRDLSGSTRGNWLYRQRRAFHAHQQKALPARLRVWAAALPPAEMEGVDLGHLQALLRHMQVFSYRLQYLQEVSPEAMQLREIGPLEELAQGVRETMAGLMEALAQDPLAYTRTRSPEKLVQAEVDLRHRIERLLDDIELSHDDSQCLYLLLSAYRGLLNAYIGSVEDLAKVGWQSLCEARF